MSTEAIAPEVAAAISDVMAGVRTLGKDSTNQHQRYNFVSTDKFLAAVNPLCCSAGLIILQEEDSTEILPGAEGKAGWLVVRYSFTLAHRSGAAHGPLHRSVMVPANGAQAYGSAQSYALKQLMRSVFQIPTGDEDDADLQAAPELPRQAERQTAKRADDPATPGQIDLLTTLMRSHVFTDAERDTVMEKVSRGMSKIKAMEAIDRAQAVIKDRKAAEKSDMDEAAELPLNDNKRRRTADVS